MSRPQRTPRHLEPVEDAATPGELLAAVGRGDEVAFAALYDQVAAMVFGLVKRVVRDHAISEEVTQEVFVEVWRQAPRYDSTKGSPHAWISTIAHRRAVDRVRSEQSSRDREQVDAASTPRDRPDVGERVVDDLDRGRVQVALRSLSDVQRQAIELAYYGGRTYREVAVLLDIAEGTAKTRIRDGLIKLRDDLEVTS